MVLNGLISHEESQTVTKAFNKLGHKFLSNDLQDCSGGHPEWHRKGDCFKTIQEKQLSLNFLGCHPECTYLTNAGVRWLASKTERKGYEWSDKYEIFINPVRYEKMRMAAIHFKSCLSWVRTIGKGYVENPIMHKYAMELIQEKPTQIIQPYWFGTPQMKATCLWIVGLPELQPTNLLTPPKKSENYKEWVAWQDCWTASPGPERAKIRSKTDPNVADAMALQWGGYVDCDCQKPWGNPMHISNYCKIHNL